MTVTASIGGVDATLAGTGGLTIGPVAGGSPTLQLQGQEYVVNQGIIYGGALDLEGQSQFLNENRVALSGTLTGSGTFKNYGVFVAGAGVIRVASFINANLVTAGVYSSFSGGQLALLDGSGLGGLPTFTSESIIVPAGNNAAIYNGTFTATTLSGGGQLSLYIANTISLSSYGPGLTVNATALVNYGTLYMNYITAVQLANGGTFTDNGSSQCANLTGTTTLVTPSASTLAPNQPFTLSVLVVPGQTHRWRRRAASRSWVMNALDPSSVTLTNGMATLSVSAGLPAGTYTFTAYYSGDGAFAPSNSVTFTLLVGNPPNFNNPGSSGPVRYADGAVQVSATDLISNGFGSTWTQTRVWSSAPTGPAANINGVGWTDDPLAYIQVNPAGPTIIVYGNDGPPEYYNYSGFVSTGVFGYNPAVDDHSTLQYFTNTDQYVLTDAAGDQTWFYGFLSSTPTDLQGQMIKQVAADGSKLWVHHNDAGQVTDVTRSSGSQVEQWVYAYLPAGNANAGLLSSVTLQRSTNCGANYTVVQQVAYTYYTSTSQHGSLGDLEFASIYDGDNLSDPIDTYYYRYYTAAEIADEVAGTGTATGYVHGLEYVFSPASYDRLVGIYGSNVDALSNTQVAPFADNYFQYNSSLQCTEDVVAGAGGGSSGQGTYTYSYTDSSNELGYNSWAMKTVQTLPDGNENIIYTNGYGETMLSVYEDMTTDQQWLTYNRYYTYEPFAGQIKFTASPSAVIGYNDSFSFLITTNDLSPNSGLITSYLYAASTTATPTTAGRVAGYLQFTLVKQGTKGAPQKQESWTYYNVTGGGDVTAPVATDTVYAGANGTDPETSTYDYTWAANSVDMLSETEIDPAATPGQDGSGVGPVTTTYFNAYGQPEWVEDPDGFINYIGYYVATGAVAMTVTDVNTSSGGAFLSSLPAGWFTQNNGGLNLVTTYQVDALGRVIEQTDPDGDETYTVYDDEEHEVRVYTGFDPLTGTTTGPIQVSYTDVAQGYTAIFTMAVPPSLDSDNEPDGDEDVANVQSLTVTWTNLAGQTTQVDQYYNLGGFTFSDDTGLPEGGEYYETKYGYNADGIQDHVVDPAGTITDTCYNGQGLLLSTWIGTNDTGANNMVEVSSNVYDNGGVGDGDLTEVIQYTHSNSPNEVTKYYYDYRDRPVVEEDGVGASGNAACAGHRDDLQQPGRGHHGADLRRRASGRCHGWQ